MPGHPEPDESASDMDWLRAAESIDSDMDNFESFIWPVYREHGLSHDTAALCFYLHLNVVEKRSAS